MEGETGVLSSPLPTKLLPCLGINRGQGATNQQTFSSEDNARI